MDKLRELVEQRLTPDQWNQVIRRTTDRAELLTKLNVLFEQCDDLEIEVKKAKQRAYDVGVYADRVWFERAQEHIILFRRVKGRLQQKLSALGAIEKVKKEAIANAEDRRKELMARVFLVAAKELLPQQLYMDIMSETLRRCRAMSDAATFAGDGLVSVDG